MKYTINSKGEVIQLESRQSHIRLIPQDIRLRELRKFSGEFCSLLSQHGINAENKKFCFLLQPNYILEQALFFTKTEFSSSSKAVKNANELELHPEILKDKALRELHQSLFSENSSGRMRWYLLSVGSVLFERNYYDCKPIRIKYKNPVPYAQFIREMNDCLSDTHGVETYSFFNEEQDINDTSYLLSRAFERNTADGITSDFDSKAVEALKMYGAVKGINERDKDSNKATFCLTVINQERHIYSAYKEAKNCIKKTFKNAYDIRYRGTSITAQIEGKKLTAYVFGENENPQFIIGGRIVRGMENFKKELHSPALFNETDWFCEKVKPFIRQNDSSSKHRIYDKDVLNWTKKTRMEK